MVIIRRSGNSTGSHCFAWDENRVEAHSPTVPIPGASIAGKGVCGFSSADPKSWMQEKLKFAVKMRGQIEKGKVALQGQMLEEAKNTKSKLNTLLRGQEATLAAALAAGTSTVSAQARLETLKAWLLEIDTVHVPLITYSTVPWPNPTAAVIDSKWATQQAPMFGTGFTFAPRYVMTADHAVEHLTKQSVLHPLHFNLHQALLPGSSSFFGRKKTLPASRPVFDSEHKIKRYMLSNPIVELLGFDADPTHRAVMRAQPYYRVFTDASSAIGHDIAILELDLNPGPPAKNPWPLPASVLTLCGSVVRPDPPSAPKNVYEIVHPYGLPLKCMS